MPQSLDHRERVSPAVREVSRGLPASARGATSLLCRAGYSLLHNPLWALSITVAYAAGCSSQTTGAPVPRTYGFAVLGPAGAVRLGQSAGDTLQEIPGTSVRDSLRIAADVEANAGGNSSRCSRYFSGTSSTVVLFAVACVQSDVVEDGGAIGVYSASGERLLVIQGPTWGFFTAVVPASRPVP